MALTATASEKTRKEVIQLLGMVRPFVIVKSPNIVYSVYEKEKELEDFFAPLVEELRHKHTQMPEVIIFCNNDCSHLFLYFKDRLGKEVTDPVGYPSTSRFQIVDMFTACNTTGVKASILSSFCANHSRLRLVIATVAFGMGH